MSSLHYFFFDLLAVYFFFLYNFLSLFFFKIMFYPTGIFLSIILIIWFYYMLVISNTMVLEFLALFEFVFDFFFESYSSRFFFF